MTPAISVCAKTDCMHSDMRVPASLFHKEAALTFTPITAETMPLLWRYLSKEEGRTCDFSYGGLLIWTPLFNYEYAIYKNTLFIKGRLEGDMSKTAYSLPIGELPLSQSVEILRKRCHAAGEALRFSAIPEHAIDDFKTLAPHSISPLPDWADYLYDIKALATLTGKKMAKKRNHVNKFESTFPDYEFLSLTPDRIADARNLLSKIEAETSEYADMAVAERRLCARTLDLMAEKETPMEGGILYASGQPVAFTIGDTKGDTLFIHIEKADRNIPGAYEAVNKYFAAKMAESHPALKYVNREDDAGDEGLRRAKESYHPLQLLAKYDIVF